MPIIMSIKRDLHLIKILKPDIVELDQQLKEMKTRINYATISREVRKMISVKRQSLQRHN